MRLKERLNRKLTMTVIERQCMIIVTLLSTLLLIKVWPRFRSDALSVEWYWYIILVCIFSFPLLFKGLNK